MSMRKNESRIWYRNVVNVKTDIMISKNILTEKDIEQEIMKQKYIYFLFFCFYLRNVKKCMDV